VELKQVREVISEEFLFFWFAVEAYFVEYSGEFVHGHQFTLGRGQRLFNLLNFGDIELLIVTVINLNLSFEFLYAFLSCFEWTTRMRYCRLYYNWSLFYFRLA
jgi:hypothetical protein